MRFREAFRYPPFYRLIRIGIRGKDQREVKGEAKEIASFLQGGEAEVLGPSPSPWGYLRGEYRWQVIVRCQRHRPMRKLLRELPRRRGGVKVEIDVDPLSME